VWSAIGKHLLTGETLQSFRTFLTTIHTPKQLVQIIDELGEYKIATHILVAHAHKHPKAFSYIEISPVTPPLREAFVLPEHSETGLATLASDISRTSVEEANQKLCSATGLSPEGLLKEYEELYRKAPSIHAEIQLVKFYEENPSTNPPKFIGSSEKTCYLCNLFVERHGRFTVSKSCPKLYPRWTVPTIVCNSGIEVERYNQIVNDMASHLEDACASALEGQSPASPAPEGRISTTAAPIVAAQDKSISATAAAMLAVPDQNINTTPRVRSQPTLNIPDFGKEHIVAKSPRSIPDFAKENLVTPDFSKEISVAKSQLTTPSITKGKTVAASRLENIMATPRLNTPDFGKDNLMLAMSPHLDTQDSRVASPHIDQENISRTPTRTPTRSPALTTRLSKESTLCVVSPRPSQDSRAVSPFSCKSETCEAKDFIHKTYEDSPPTTPKAYEDSPPTSPKATIPSEFDFDSPKSITPLSNRDGVRLSPTPSTHSLYKLHSPIQPPPQAWSDLSTPPPSPDQIPLPPLPPSGFTSRIGTPNIPGGVTLPSSPPPSPDEIPLPTSGTSTRVTTPLPNLRGGGVVLPSSALGSAIRSIPGSRVASSELYSLPTRDRLPSVPYTEALTEPSTIPLPISTASSRMSSPLPPSTKGTPERKIGLGLGLGLGLRGGHGGVGSEPLSTPGDELAGGVSLFGLPNIKSIDLPGMMPGMTVKKKKSSRSNPDIFEDKAVKKKSSKDEGEVRRRKSSGDSGVRRKKSDDSTAGVHRKKRREEKEDTEVRRKKSYDESGNLEVKKKRSSREESASRDPGPRESFMSVGDASMKVQISKPGIITPNPEDLLNPRSARSRDQSRHRSREVKRESSRHQSRDQSRAPTTHDPSIDDRGRADHLQPALKCSERLQSLSSERMGNIQLQPSPAKLATPTKSPQYVPSPIKKSPLNEAKLSHAALLRGGAVSPKLAQRPPLTDITSSQSPSPSPSVVAQRRLEKGKFPAPLSATTSLTTTSLTSASLSASATSDFLASPLSRPVRAPLGALNLTIERTQQLEPEYTIYLASNYSPKLGMGDKVFSGRITGAGAKEEKGEMLQCRGFKMRSTLRARRTPGARKDTLRVHEVRKTSDQMVIDIIFPDAVVRMHVWWDEDAQSAVGSGTPGMGAAKGRTSVAA
jgi:hypothetical protein